MNIETIEVMCFLSVAELKSFTKAADVVFLTQPAISQNIRRLEQKLGVELFSRKPRKVELTDAGQTLFSELSPFSRQYDHMVSLTRMAANGQMGSIRLGLISTAASLVIPRLLQKFRKEMPLVTVELNYGLTAQQVSLLTERAIDIGFFRTPCEDRSLKLEIVHSEPFRVYFSKTHPLARGHGAVECAALRGETLLLYKRENAPGYHDQILAFLREGGVVPSRTYEGSDMYTLVTMVSSGLGVAIAPASLMNYGVRNIISRSIAGRVPQAQIAMGYRADLDHPPALAFIDFVKKGMGQRAQAS